MQDTITAISTPPGEGGIGIVRISGPLSLSIAARLFRPPPDPNKIESHKARVGKLVASGSGEVIDQVILLPMPAPNSYTAEDVVEFHCHGGRVTLALILRETLNLGARMAEPGEFSKRAFLNGKIDLTRAEAVISLIKSTSEGSHRVAVRQLEGGLYRAISDFREKLLDLLAGVEADIDFPEEDVAPTSISHIREVVREVSGDIQALKNTYKHGRVLRDGVETAIIGRPNVGKSSLLNALIKFDRAIVDPTPGTTRDIIEETVNIRGIPLKIIDTAGIRNHGDRVEEEGIRRAKKAAQDADLIVAVFDVSSELCPEDMETAEVARGKETILVINKIDLVKRLDTAVLSERFPASPLVHVSAKAGQGLDLLEEAIHAKIWKSEIDLTENVLITRMRHEEKLGDAAEALTGVLNAIDDSLPLEFIAADLRSALERLGDITGESFSEEILNRIFSEFCIGK